ncbi:MAG: hypothetical protein WAZ18_07335 [Alphaproteobacteria bacterium]
MKKSNLIASALAAGSILLSGHSANGQVKIQPHQATQVTTVTTNQTITPQKIAHHIQDIKIVLNKLGIYDISSAFTAKNSHDFSTRSLQIIQQNIDIPESDIPIILKRLNQLHSAKHFAQEFTLDDDRKVHIFASEYASSQNLETMSKSSNLHHAAVAYWTYAHEASHPIFIKYFQNQLKPSGIDQETAADIGSFHLIKTTLGQEAFDDLYRVVKAYRKGTVPLHGYSHTHGSNYQSNKLIYQHVTNTPAFNLMPEEVLRVFQETPHFIHKELIPNKPESIDNLEQNIMSELRSLAGLKAGDITSIDFTLTQKDIERIKLAYSQLITQPLYSNDPEMMHMAKRVATQMMRAVEGRSHVYNQDRQSNSTISLDPSLFGSKR